MNIKYINRHTCSQTYVMSRYVNSFVILCYVILCYVMFCYVMYVCMCSVYIYYIYTYTNTHIYVYVCIYIYTYTYTYGDIFLTWHHLQWWCCEFCWSRDLGSDVKIREICLTKLPPLLRWSFQKGSMDQWAISTKHIPIVLTSKV